MDQQCGKIRFLNNWLILAHTLRKTKCGRAKTKKKHGRNWNKTNTNPKEKSCTHKRYPRQRECWSRKHSEKNKPRGSSDFVVAALFTFVMYGLMLREIF